MTAWTTTELATIAAADEVTIAVAGATRDVTIWVVRVGDDVIVRSYRGAGGAWHRAAIDRRAGHLHAGDVDRDVTFDDYHGDTTAVDDAYRAKYGRCTYVDTMVTTEAARATLRLSAR